MICRIDEMKQKQVVDVGSGTVIGFLSDIEFDTDSGLSSSAALKRLVFSVKRMI